MLGGTKSNGCKLQQNVNMRNRDAANCSRDQSDAKTTNIFLCLLSPTINSVDIRFDWNAHQAASTTSGLRLPYDTAALHSPRPRPANKICHSCILYSLQHFYLCCVGVRQTQLLTSNNNVLFGRTSNEDIK